MSKSFGGMIFIAFLIVIVFVAVMFVPKIFGAQEASVNMSGSIYADQYNATTGLAISGMNLMIVGIFILCLLCFILALKIFL